MLGVLHGHVQAEAVMLHDKLSNMHHASCTMRHGMQGVHYPAAVLPALPLQPLCTSKVWYKDSMLSALWLCAWGTGAILQIGIVSAGHGDISRRAVHAHALQACTVACKAKLDSSPLLLHPI